MKFKYIATAILALSSLFACKQMVEDVPASVLLLHVQLEFSYKSMPMQ